MTEDGESTPRNPADFAGQLRKMADTLMSGWATAAGAASRPPSLPKLPALPATMSARQMQALLDDLAARRAQVRALLAQLEIFDGQLGTLEENLRPLLEWTRMWADLEKSMADFWRLPGSESTG